MLATYASEIWSAIGGAIVGALGGSLLTLRISRSHRTSHTANGHGSIIDQSGSRVRGDQVGGNKTPTESD